MHSKNVFRDVAACSLVDTDRRFSDCLDGSSKHLERRSVPTILQGATSHKTIIFTIVVRSRLGGVVVNVLTTGPKDRGFEPSQGNGFLRAAA
jgi:hypothetical protein